MNASGRQESGVRGEAIVLPCPDPDAAAAFFTDSLGFRIESVFPADDPKVVEVSGHGLRIRLVRQGLGEPVVPAAPSRELPALAPCLVLSRAAGATDWHTGRAGMQYRDLIPDRQSGRFIASHIRIPAGGSVPDYVHYHTIRFQMIFCYRGWVRAVYEDQGPPFVLNAGDCVLQPPRIRHRVLESSPGLEVIEVSSPAEHETRADHDLSLPTPAVDAGREFGGQRFVRHVAARAPWSDDEQDSFAFRDTGIAAATRGLAGVRVVRATTEGASTPMTVHQGEFLFRFVLDGSFRLHREVGVEETLSAGDAFVVHAGTPHALAECTKDFQFLEVRSPAA